MPATARSVDLMMAQAAHDLQEPLRLLSGYLDLLVASIDDDAPLDKAMLAHEARDAAERMQRMVASVLDEARARASASARSLRDDVVMGDALVEAQRNMKRRLEASGAILQVEALPTLRGDSTQVTRLFQNLLENSLKYAATAPGRHVTIRVTAAATPTEWIVCVDDNGPGWPEGRERLFQPYVRLGSSDESGLGLGLAAVRSIVEGMGGTVQALDAPGGGARVEMRFARSA